MHVRVSFSSLNYTWIFLVCDQNVFRSSLEVFSNLWKSLEILWKFSENVWRSLWVCLAFLWFWRIFRSFQRVVVNLWKIAKKRHYTYVHCITRMLCNKRKITWLLRNVKFLFSCWKLFYSFAVFTHELFFNTQREIFISVQSCYILYVIPVSVFIL